MITKLLDGTARSKDFESRGRKEPVPRLRTGKEGAPRSFWIATDPHRVTAFRIVEAIPWATPRHFELPNRDAAEGFLFDRGVSDLDVWEAIDRAMSDGISSIPGSTLRFPRS